MALRLDRESHEDSAATEMTEELQPAKVPLLTKDIVNSKKVHAMRKELKRKLGKQRSMGSPVDYSPMPVDKHEPEFVSIAPVRPRAESSFAFVKLGHVVSTGTLPEKTGRHHSGNERHVSSHGALFVPSQL